MARTPVPRDAATAALGMPVQQWIARQRATAARLTYRQIARVLLSDYGIDVTPEAVRQWAATVEPAATELVWPHHYSYSDGSELCEWSGRSAEPGQVVCPAGHEHAPVVVSPLLPAERGLRVRRAQPCDGLVHDVLRRAAACARGRAPGCVEGECMMSTRGFVGFVADGTEKIAYNHYDSYPGGLGLDVLRWLREAATDLASLRQQVIGLRVVDWDSTPSREDIQRLRRFANPNVGQQTVEDWYVLLRETWGDPAAMLRAGVIADSSDFPLHPFAKWGYLVNLDEGTFEVYERYDTPSGKGRFADRVGVDNCEPIALFASWPLADLPDDDAFLASFGDAEEVV